MITFQPDWTTRTDAALAWIRHSIGATGEQGSAHSYSLLRGWAAAYPETTGYLIPTLLHFAGLKADPSLRQLAFSCARWLCQIQLPGGAWTGLTADYAQPSVFNTAQILFGLSKLDGENLAEDIVFQKTIRHSLETGARWLLDQLDTDAVWRQAAYVPGFVPSYYTRAVWALLEAQKRLQWTDLEEKMQLAIHWYARRFQANGAISDWGFRPGAAAFSHTIAYTLEGFLEVALLLDEPTLLARTAASADRLLDVRKQAGRTAGRYDIHWQGDYSFRCLSGNAQLSVLYYRLWQIFNVLEYRRASADFLSEILEFQDFSKNKNRYGALPGSAPVWGPYLRFRYPNWGVKFLLDALANWAPEPLHSPGF